MSELRPLAKHAAALWRQVQERRKPAHLIASLRKLEAAHGQLTRLEASLPATGPADRLRRRCIEALQAHNVELERLLEKLEVGNAELGSLLAHQLDRSRELMKDSPPVQTIRCWTDGPHVPDVLAVLGAIGPLALWAPWLFIPALLLSFLLAQLLKNRPSVEFAFDGRTLRLSRRTLWWWFRSSTFDLSEFSEVRLITSEHHPQFALVSDSRALLVNSRLASRQADEVIATVREWCAAAAGER